MVHVIKPRIIIFNGNQKGITTSLSPVDMYQMGVPFDFPENMPEKALLSFIGEPEPIGELDLGFKNQAHKFANWYLRFYYRLDWEDDFEYWKVEHPIAVKRAQENYIGLIPMPMKDPDHFPPLYLKYREILTLLAWNYKIGYLH